MYDIIKNLINHTWQSNYTSDQQYIYYIAGTVIILFVVWVFDIFPYTFIPFLQASSANLDNKVVLPQPGKPKYKDIIKAPYKKTGGIHAASLN